MKTEYEGEKVVALTCKTYFCEGKSKKQVCKGVSIRQNPLTFEKYFPAHQKHMSGFNFNPTLEHILLNLVCILFRVM